MFLQTENVFKNILTRGVGAGGLVDSTTVAGLLKKGSGTVV